MKLKFKAIILVLFMLLVSVSCTPDIEKKEIYSITYYVDGKIEHFTLNGYEKGTAHELPVASTDGIDVFDGWYDNPNYEGAKITEIKSTDSGDKIFFGRIVNGSGIPGPIVKSYTITFDSNGGSNVESQTVEEGKTATAPSNPTKEGHSFEGWLLNGVAYDFANAVNSDITLVASWKEEVVNNSPTLEDLANALNKNNYTYVYKEYDGEYTYQDIYHVDQDNIYLEYEYEGSYEYYYLINEGTTAKYYYQDGTSWTYEEVDYEEYLSYFVLVSLSSLDANSFEYNEKKSCFIAKTTTVQQEAENLMMIYEGEVFNNFELYLENGIITRAYLTSAYTYEGTSYTGEYTITFSKVGTTVVEAPDATITPDPIDVTISDVYSYANGDSVDITGIVTGVYGNNFYIADETGSLLVYMGNDSTYNTIVVEGNLLSISGSISIYKDLHQVANVTSVSVESSNNTIEAFELTDVSQTNLAMYPAGYVNVTGAQIVSLPTSYPTSGSDITFEVSLNGVEVDVFISKHLVSTYKEAIFNTLQQLKVGSVVNLNGLNISKYTAYQLVMTSSASIEEGYKEGDSVIQTSLVLEPTSTIVEVGTTFEEAMSHASVYAKYNNGTKELLVADSYTITGTYNPEVAGTYEITITHGTFTAYFEIVVKAPAQDAFTPTIDGAPLYDHLDEMGVYDGVTYGITKGLPSSGNPKVLVIPVEFTDALASSTMVEDLETAFFGTSTETGWESLQSYYYKSSYGKLTIEGTVLEPFNTGKTVSYYNLLQNEYNEDLDAYLNYETDVMPDNVEWSILKAALAYYDEQINYSDYDTDNDGYIDSIYMIYTCDYSTEDGSLWWAFTTEYYTEEVEYYDEVEADYYIFMSYQFLTDQLQGETVTYNAETIIHETGHLLGLDDYYDYSQGEGPDGGIGGGDMMDYNVGDHNAYSKLMLGWVTPLVVTGQDITLDLESFEQSGDCVIVLDEWNGTFFDEYYIIDFFTPTGVNEIGAGSSGLFAVSGVRIYHIDATLNNSEDCWSIFELTKYNNSYTDHRLITLVEADGANDIDNLGWSEDTDLFQANTSFSNPSWYDGTTFDFTVTVNSIGTSSANITITFQ